MKCEPLNGSIKKDFIRTDLIQESLRIYLAQLFHQTDSLLLVVSALPPKIEDAGVWSNDRVPVNGVSTRLILG